VKASCICYCVRNVSLKYRYMNSTFNKFLLSDAVFIVSDLVMTTVDQ